MASIHLRKVRTTPFSPLTTSIEPKDALLNAPSISKHAQSKLVLIQAPLNLLNKMVESSLSGSASLVCITANWFSI
jgi:hypothetical protein